MKTTQHYTPAPWAMHPIYTKGILTHWGINGVKDTGTQFTSGRIVDVPRNAPNHDGPTQEANAARIVACVNACAGLSDPTADLAALREALQYCANYHQHGNFDFEEKARAALARSGKERA